MGDLLNAQRGFKLPKQIIIKIIKYKIQSTEYKGQTKLLQM
jgi:hypothetical protein